MKIKRKVQKNLPQLIEWGWKNGVENKEYVCNEHKAKSVIFNLMGWAEFSDEFSYNPHDTFTVEVEEEITEDTFFKHLIKVTEDGQHYSVDSLEVRDLIYLSTEEVHAYIDGEYKLIWTHEKGLVE
ncbi:hypothetical protein QI101_10710 [Staphylococcus saprophyticus]|nr:hypothetical protein [Staphylococcus saprophyticus]